MKRKLHSGCLEDDDGRQLRCNKAWFRQWGAISTYADYLNLTPPSAYEPEPANEAVRRQELERKIWLPYATLYSSYSRMNDDSLMQECSTESR